MAAIGKNCSKASLGMSVTQIMHLPALAGNLPLLYIVAAGNKCKF